MAVILDTGEVVFCNEVDVIGGYVIADMVFIPEKQIYEIMELEEPYD